MTRLSAYAMVLVSLHAVSGAENEQMMEELLKLGKISVERTPHGRRVTPSEDFARRQFPIRDAATSQILSKIIQVPRSTNFTNGLTGVLDAHGAGGFLWGLSELAKTDSTAVRANLGWALRHFRYRETAILYSALLDDTRPVPRPVLIPGHDWVSMNLGGGPDPDCGPERICDQAARYVLTVALSYLPRTPPALPERFKGMNANLGPSSLTKERDDGIAMLKAWWKEEGERLVMTTRPSFIEELLKPPEPKPEAAPDQETKQEPKENPPRP